MTGHEGDRVADGHVGVSREASPAPSGQFLSVTDDEAIVTFTLDRPGAGNAINMQLACELLAATKWLATNTTARALVLTGRGRMFCAGGDLHEMAEAAERTTFLQLLADTMHEAILGLHELPLPIVAAVHGPAAGAGIGLVLAADIAVASDAASFSAAYGKIGLSPDCGVTAVLPATVGRRRAAQFTLTDITLNASQALDWGLVSEICPALDLPQRTQEIAYRLRDRSSAGPTALLNRRSDQPLPAALRDEAATIASLGGSADASKRIADFLNGSAAAGKRHG